MSQSLRFKRSVFPSPSSQSLPARWKRGRQRAALSCLALMVLFTGVVHEQGGADQIETWWLRARFSLREWLDNHLRVPRPDGRIVLVEMDDKSSDRWQNEPFIAWNGHIAAAIKQLNRSGARLIALDWIQTSPSSSWLKIDHDGELIDALGAARRVVFVKMLRPDGRATKPFNAFLSAPRGAYSAEGRDQTQQLMGFAELVNQDSIQTAIYPLAPAQTDGSEEVSFALRIAQNSGWNVPALSALREDGSLLINYASNAGKTGAASPFQRVSLGDVAAAKAPDARFKDKIVLIGATFKGDNDTHFVPFLNGLTGARQISGLEVQANAVATLLSGGAIAEPESVAVWLLCGLSGAFGVLAYALWSWGRAARTVSITALSWALLSFVLFKEAHYAMPLILPLLCLMVGAGLMGGYRALSEERERAQVMNIWGRYQDPRLIDELLAHPELQSGQGREVVVTVLFADLKNFTKTVEHLAPAQALEALNRYLALLSKSISEHGGYVDKYLGDGLMAEWGVPVERADHASAAVRACLDIENQVAFLSQNLQKSGDVTFGVRLTLHTGPVVAGPLGSEKLEYTIIGDTVNVTSRLQETAKALGCDFLISQTTCEAMDVAVQTGRETSVEIRGREAPLKVFEVLNPGISAKALREVNDREVNGESSVEMSSETAKTSQKERIL